MEIHQLSYVLAVARYQHFSRAAAEICVSQSTLSQQIEKLEKELGVRLFERTTRSVRLTQAGQEFVSYARRILADVDQARNAMQMYTSMLTGQITVGAIPIIGHLGLTKMLASFQSTYPKVRLIIHENGSVILLDMLCALNLDVALLTPPRLAPRSVIFYPLLTDRVVLVTSRRHPLAAYAMVDLAAARHEAFILMKAGFGMLRICLDACHAVGFEPNVIFQSSEINTILGLVEAGMGVTLLTRRLAMSFGPRDVALIDLNQPIYRTTALAVLRQAQQHAPVVAAFLKYARQWAQQQC